MFCLTAPDVAAKFRGVTVNDCEIFSRKVFIGGLPVDANQESLFDAFHKFGRFVIDWPLVDNGIMPGYTFLVFTEETSVQALNKACFEIDSRKFWWINTPTCANKPIEVRPWKLSSSNYQGEKLESRGLEMRYTAFIGGVPRCASAQEVYDELCKYFKDVLYVDIDLDPELKYPKGAARVVFGSDEAFISAIRQRFIQIPCIEVTKQAEIKPYVVSHQLCEQCQTECTSCFCGDASCLQYYCDPCWLELHSGRHAYRKRRAHRAVAIAGIVNRFNF